MDAIEIRRKNNCVRTFVKRFFESILPRQTKTEKISSITFKTPTLWIFLITISSHFPPWFLTQPTLLPQHPAGSGHCFGTPAVPPPRHPFPVPAEPPGQRPRRGALPAWIFGSPKTKLEEKNPWMENPKRSSMENKHTKKHPNQHFFSGCVGFLKGIYEKLLQKKQWKHTLHPWKLTWLLLLVSGRVVGKMINQNLHFFSSSPIIRTASYSPENLSFGSKNDGTQVRGISFSRGSLPIFSRCKKCEFFRGKITRCSNTSVTPWNPRKIRPCLGGAASPLEDRSIEVFEDFRSPKLSSNLFF